MQPSPSDTIVRMFSYGQKILLDLVDFVYALFTTPLREYVIMAQPFLGPINETILDVISRTPLFDFNMLELFLFLIPVFVAITLVKWIIGIIM